ncbi:hypothetical protein DFJ43DRAFT_139042 [Lentinula guzmanii]|uniref:Uncharacterized protein n=1 Tax=Lentinula guzmanii TaxID=2804957 RepID=A0AA38J638_9AGAR|nr:hypothetical protein DFJ43DRAFT_139042 [Lentinula guzmanii]
MPTIQRSKPALQSFRWPSARAVTVIKAYTDSPPASITETLPQYHSDILNSKSSEPNTYYIFFHSLQSTQKVAARLLEDPGFTRARIFRFSAPIAVFLSLLATIALLPQEWYVDDLPENKAMSVKFAKAGFLLMMALMVVFGTLSFLWLLIWLLALSVRRFMEVDLSARQKSSGVFNNVLGGLFTN